MKTALRNLTFAAALALTALGGARARADDLYRGPPAAWPTPRVVPACDGWRDRGGWRDRDRDGWQDQGGWDGRWWRARDDRDGWQDRGGWEGRGWRARVRAQVRGELVELDRSRADFHARWDRDPREVRRFEAWYWARRAELERRYAELSPWAMR